MTPSLTILEGDNRKTIGGIADESVDLCLTSPPYFGQRDYGIEGQMGHEQTVEEYVAELVALFELVKPKLKEDGTLWLNLGDGYNSGQSGSRTGSSLEGGPQWRPGSARADGVVKKASARNRNGQSSAGYKHKDLMMIPARVALALQASGWWLRAACPWIKRNGMPDSVKGRPSQTIEMLYMLTKSEDCFYDYEAVKIDAKFGTSDKEPNGYQAPGQARHTTLRSGHKRRSVERGDFAGKTNTLEGRESFRAIVEKRARRASDFFFETWQGLLLDEETEEPIAFVVNVAPFREAHFAVYPERLIKPCVMASCRGGGVVLDPFGGSGTTGKVALELGRSAILCELNPDYVKIIKQRCNITPGLNLQ